ncbi:arginase [Sphingobacterium sp. SG20118]|uniref:arginase n=1 Tax=Sphingobacterium TaxID=28453 RepID=UPI0004F74C4C|nr:MULTISPECIES: arginase [Sphingobacterium]AIM36312.1 arginase [Sphingobacterium sp. ML3W]MDH5827557.1 arginase [Sphingobacterium faecium]
MKRSIKIIKNRSDIGAGTRGSDLGIDAIEIAAINKGSQYFHDYPFVDVKTRNDAIYDRTLYPFAKRIKQVLKQCREVASVVEKTLEDDHFPLVFSGDHSSAIGTISGIKAAFPHKTLGIIWIDAHADIHSPYTTPSGNMHGMPLAATMDEDNLSCAVNAIDEDTKKYWHKLKEIGGKVGKFKSKNLVYFGVRDTEEPEDILMRELEVKNYTVDEVRNKTVSCCVIEVLQKLENCDMIYVSFDVDSMDSELISNGTGTPVPKGFFPTEIVALLEGILSAKKVVCFEIVEVNPLLDNKGNKAAEVAFDILEKVTKSIERTVKLVH